MNNEVIKVMRNKPENKVCKWWRKNNYKVWRVVLFPVWAVIVIKDKIKAQLYHKEDWNEDRAIQILNYYIPRRAKWDEEDKCLYFFDNGLGWNYKLAKRYLKRKDRRFWKVHCTWCGGKMRTLLMEKFELEGFTKKLGECSEGWTEVSFILKEN